LGERALYLGPGLPATVHAHHAVQVCIPLSGTVRLRTGPGARWGDYQGAVIPSNCAHESDRPVSLIAAFWLEPDTAEALRLVQPRGELLIRSVDRSRLTEIVQLLLAAWRDSFTSQRAAALTEEIVRILAPAEAPHPAIDRRVARALGIQASAPGRRVSLAATAAAVSLSPSRLAHLFTPAVGIPPRRYLLWLRLRDAVQELAQGAPITTAAHAAGFADAAHLSRTFRRMLGFTPSAALRVSRFVQDAPAHN
jgi:AraC-like DNA-binding protein